MAHQVEQMMYVGDVPWHGLGVKLDNPPTIEEAIRFAGLDWTVERKPLVIEGTTERVPAYAIIRETDKRRLGLVGPTYRPLQNADAFRWFQPFLDSKEVTLETAGSLRGGRHVWILARLNRDPIEIVPGDPVVNHILLSNSHNGSRSIRGGFTGVRVVCANTVAAAHRSGKLLKVRHTDAAVEALVSMREAMQLGSQEFVATTSMMKRMARKGVTTASLKQYVRRVFEAKVVLDSEETDPKGERLLAKIVPLFESGRGNDMPGVKGTLWGAYNAVTEYLTWQRGRSSGTRLESLWLGDAANIGKRAFDVAIRMAA